MGSGSFAARTVHLTLGGRPRRSSRSNPSANFVRGFGNGHDGEVRVFSLSVCFTAFCDFFDCARKKNPPPNGDGMVLSASLHVLEQLKGCANEIQWQDSCSV